MLELSDDDGILTDLDEETLNGDTEIAETTWDELKDRFYQDNTFDRRKFSNSLSQSDRLLLQRLIEAQEEQGWQTFL